MDFGERSEENRSGSCCNREDWIRSHQQIFILSGGYLQINENNGIQLTNEAIRLKTIRAAQNITKLGFMKGDMIGIMARNGHNLAPIVFAAMSIGCPLSTLDPTFDKIAILHMLGITKPKMIFCDHDDVINLHEILNDANILVPLYSFNGSTAYSQAVEDLLEPTYIEHQFL